VGDSAGYSDTDSFQFSAWPIMKPLVEAGEATWSAEECIALYDELASKVNTSFPEFMEKSFHIPMERGAIIKCGREVVARRGIFITKKRYAMLMIDKDGTRLDMGGSPGKVKAMGLDLKRADTPKIVQDFLSDILLDLLCGHDISVIIAKINDFKIVFNALPAWEKGTPKRVNNLSNFAAREKALGKANLPGHVRAALNWNNLRKIYSDKHSIQIVDGMKVVVCKLRQNPVGYASVAYPTDSHNLPEWFTSLPFDESLMATTIVDKKIENLFSELAEWKEIENQTQARFDSFNSLFSFD